MPENKLKVVYNGCFGGFSLSRKAILRARELSGNPKWGGPCITGDVSESGDYLVTKDYGFADAPRHDPFLVRVVEELGKEASGEHASLCIEEIQGEVYRIIEYDGSESVETPNTIDDWVRA